MTHYYDENQDSKLQLTQFKARLRGKELDFYSAKGVFSKEKADKGTELLANTCQIKEGSKVLDIGCGIGILGIAIKKDCPACKVVMTDINIRATRLARMNAGLNDTDITILQGNLYAPIKDTKFDAIIVNPPYVAGRELCYKIITEAKTHLETGGNLQLVARHQKGGKMLEKKMQETFGNVEEISKKAGYRVYKSEKR